MFHDVVSQFQAMLGPAWSQELAGLLPLTVLASFVDIARSFHLFQLAGLVPLWLWTITPAGGRLLLDQVGGSQPQPCCLDQPGQTPNFVCLDGRYGDKYATPSPATLRLILEGLHVADVPHPNGGVPRPGARTQTINLVYATRKRHQGRLHRPLTFLVADVIGWTALVGLLVLCSLFRLWLALAFLLAMPMTGIAVASAAGVSRPLSLGTRDPTGSDKNRLVIMAQHLNDTEWYVFYGEKNIVNALLNRPLAPKSVMPIRQEDSAAAESAQGCRRLAGRALLHASILLQWSMALASACTKGWDAYVVSLWVILCILSQTWAFSPARGVRFWLRCCVGVQLDCYRARLNSRRALLNAIVALNPDSFPLHIPRGTPGKEGTPEESVARVDYSRFHPEGLLWLDPILKKCRDRSKWESLTRQGMRDAFAPVDNGSCRLQAAWKENMRQQPRGGQIVEGIEVAQTLTREAGLSTLWASA